MNTSMMIHTRIATLMAPLSRTSLMHQATSLSVVVECAALERVASFSKFFNSIAGNKLL
jgi:hypothetical protein